VSATSAASKGIRDKNDRTASVVDGEQELEERLQTNIAELREEMRRVERSVIERVKTLEAKVKKSDIGNVHMEYVGASWVGIGLFVATLPEWVEVHIRARLEVNWVQSVYSFLCG
jgi:hypothetical protein